MKRATLLMLGAWVLGLGMGAGAMRTLAAGDEPFKRTVLLRADVAGPAEREVVISLVDLAPGAASGRHWHPAHEFAYLLEGEAATQVDGAEPVALKPGEVVHILPQKVHEGRNASTVRPARLLVFHVAEQGQPLTTAAEK
ncbi:MAG: cupin domain-containing protein [Planctomycetes bacterium]|nr:cupin domain-containing protein [Planctomycetota bacterium]